MRAPQGFPETITNRVRFVLFSIRRRAVEMESVGRYDLNCFVVDNYADNLCYASYFRKQPIKGKFVEKLSENRGERVFPISRLFDA